MNLMKHLLVFSFGLGLLLPFNNLLAQYGDESIIFSDTSGSTHMAINRNYIVTDFNNDTESDIILTHSKWPDTSTQLTWLKGDGQGQFVTQGNIDTFHQRYATGHIFYSDLNKDGLPDLVMQTDAAKYTIYQNDGHGNITKQIESSLPISDVDEISIQEIIDIDQDNDLDLILWLRVDTSVYPVITFNDGTGNMIQHKFLENQSEAVYNLIKTGDIDGDGDMDIICSGNGKIKFGLLEGPMKYLDPFLIWFENEGNGNFKQKKELTLPQIENRLPDYTYFHLSDIDNDGNEELFIEYAIQDSCGDVIHQLNCVFFYRYHILDYNNQEAEFSTIREYNSWLHGYTMMPYFYSYKQFYDEAFISPYRDENEDENIDILSVNVPQGKLLWYYGNGHGIFGNPQEVHTSSLYSGIRPNLRVVDYDNDQDSDIFVLLNNENMSKLSLIKNKRFSATNNLNSGQEIVVFPNPSKQGENLQIQVPQNSDFQNIRYRIFQITGNLLNQGICTNNHISTENLHPGIYILEVFTGNKRHKKKFVIANK